MTLTQKHGGVAMVLINSVAGGVVQVGTCSIGKISAVPGIAVNREIGEWMTRLLKEGPVRMKISAAATSGSAIARNVVGEIVGETEEVVMIGGHLDSWDLAQGAIDNGAGVAVVLETARALGSLKRKPRRTLRFVLFMGEELGLYGSRAYVKAHEKELDRIVMMMNLDMCGKPSGYALGPCEEALDFFRVLSAKLERLGLGAAPTAKAGLHSDHQPFMMAGVPTMTLQSKLDDEQGRSFHSAGDTFDLVKEEYLNEAAVASAIALWALATAPDRPAPRLTSDQVRERCIRDGVKEALELMDDWPFRD
jgi:Zn-dependent M28 family amino/carboxypeptidase